MHGWRITHNLSRLMMMLFRGISTLTLDFPSRIFSAEMIRFRHAYQGLPVDSCHCWWSPGCIGLSTRALFTQCAQTLHSFKTLCTVCTNCAVFRHCKGFVITVCTFVYHCAMCTCCKAHIIGAKHQYLGGDAFQKEPTGLFNLCAVCMQTVCTRQHLPVYTFVHQHVKVNIYS